MLSVSLGVCQVGCVEEGTQVARLFDPPPLRGDKAIRAESEGNLDQRSNGSAALFTARSGAKRLEGNTHRQPFTPVLVVLRQAFQDPLCPEKRLGVPHVRKEGKKVHPPGTNFP